MLQEIAKKPYLQNALQGYEKRITVPTVNK